MKFGLSEDQLRQIRDVLSKHPGITEALIFGSRAMGNYKEASDVDIALKGEVTAKTAMEVKDELEEETDLPFFFDIVSTPTIDNPELVEHISKHGLLLWRASTKEFSLLELCELLDTRRKPLSSSERTAIKGPYPYYGASGIIDHIDRYEFSEDTVLISEDGENLNSRKTPIAFKASGKYWVNNHAHVLRPNKEHLFPIIINYLEAMDLSPFVTGAVQPKLSQENLSKIRIELPVSENEQRTIASVLSSLDDKIDLLHRQNKTLEGMASALWKKMFEEELDPDWQVGKLGDFIETTSGGTPSRSHPEYYIDGEIKWIKSKELQSTFIFDTEEKITREALRDSAAKLLPKNTVLLAMYGATVGEYGLLTEEAACNQAICALIPNKKFPYTFIFMFLKKNKEEIINQAIGSAQQNISQVIIQNLDFIGPNDTILKFHERVSELFEKIKANVFQIRQLSKLRDTLLPKLISGELAVKA